MRKEILMFCDTELEKNFAIIKVLFYYICKYLEIFSI